MRRNRSLNLTEDERYLLTYYTNIYNQQLRSIDLMYNELRETREIIDYITRVNNRTSNSNTVYRMDYYIPLSTNNNLDNLESVPIVATNQEIERNTRLVYYSEIESPLNNSCPITLERFENNTELTQIIGCGHLFIPSGLNRWLRSHTSCPICRYDIRNEINENNRNEINENEINEINENNRNENNRNENIRNENIRNENNNTEIRTPLTESAYVDISLNVLTEQFITSFLNRALNGRY